MLGGRFCVRRVDYFCVRFVCCVDIDGRTRRSINGLSGRVFAATNGRYPFGLVLEERNLQSHTKPSAIFMYAVRSPPPVSDVEPLGNFCEFLESRLLLCVRVNLLLETVGPDLSIPWSSPDRGHNTLRLLRKMGIAQNMLKRTDHSWQFLPHPFIQAAAKGGAPSKSSICGG